ncbi:MAG: hypothetical protein KUL78_07375 [Flavobacterium sp.]|nr:hypothetical protein [Flavobacterium sp.]
MKVITNITQIASEPVSPRLDGSTNGLKLSAIGIYTLPSNLKETDIFVFILPDIDGQDDNYIIIPTSELFTRMDYNNLLNLGTFQIKLWLTNDGRVYEMRHRSGEYEFMGMYIDADRNWTEYLNNWKIIKN